VTYEFTKVADFIHTHLGPEFHDKKIAKLQALSLEGILKRKNPYLFRAKNAVNANDFIKAVLDATVSSGEETVFGNFLERVAIFVCEQTFGGRKSGIKGIDLEFEDKEVKYIVSIKSGPNWGNSGQIEKLIDNFKLAKKTFATSGGNKNTHIICIEACCYGSDNNPEKGTHRKLCGQEFWSLISGGSETLYQELIVPLGYQANERNVAIDKLYGAKLALFTKDFVERFCPGGLIDWPLLLAYNSGKNTQSRLGDRDRP
jgi:hypothetical protein